MSPKTPPGAERVTVPQLCGLQVRREGCASVQPFGNCLAGPAKLHTPVSWGTEPSP